MLEQVQKMLAETFPDEPVTATADERNIVTLTGECSTWQTVINVGHAVAHVEGVRNVVCEMTAKGVTIPHKDYTPYVQAGQAKGVVDEADVVVVGAGITGCGIARELCKYDLRIIVVDMGDDVATGCSKANNGCVHHGMDCKPGTLKAELNVKGNRRYTDWANELNFRLDRIGYIEVVTEAEDLPKLYGRFEQGLRNGVPEIKIVGKEEAYRIDPAIEKEGVDVLAALYLPTHGETEPYRVCVALAENAADNGVQFRFNCTVGDVLVENGAVAGVVTNQGIIKTRYVVDAAGIYADEIAAMAGDKMYTLHNRRGTIAIFDNAVKPTFREGYNNYSKVTKKDKDVESKGGGMHPTVDHNILLGPSAYEVPDKEDVETTQRDVDYIRPLLQDPHATWGDVIKIFAGARPADFKEDFTVELSEKTKGFVHASCIQSPGFASAPAVADLVVEMVTEDMKKDGREATLRPDYNPIRKQKTEFRYLSREEQDKLIQKDPRYGRIICRCEQITEGEILDAIRSPVVPTSVDAIKRRTRAGMGRCQGGFCQPRVLEILARELGKEWVDITLKGEKSNILRGENRCEAGEGAVK